MHQTKYYIFDPTKFWIFYALYYNMKHDSSLEPICLGAIHKLDGQQDFDPLPFFDVNIWQNLFPFLSLST